MSQSSYYNIHCPKCQNQQEVKLYDSINVVENPELKDQLMTNQLNRVVCERCEFEFRTDKNLLYSDPSQQLMIFLMQATESELEQIEAAFEEANGPLQRLLPSDVNPVEAHLVINRTELVERIFLFEAGLNHRLIEYIKYQIYIRNLEQIDPMARRLLFNAQDSTDEYLRFVVQDLGTLQFESVVDYPRKGYDALQDALENSDDQAAMIMELFPGPYINARLSIAREQEIDDVMQASENR